MLALTDTAKAFTYNAGEMAYYENGAGGGLVPVKVIKVKRPGYGGKMDSGRLVVKVTANRPGFSLGQVIETTAFRVIPRKKVFRHLGTVKVETNYYWK